MRLGRIIAIAAGTVALAGASAYAELVLDVRTPHSDLAYTHALGTNVSVSLVSYNTLLEEMRRKYGDRAQVHFEYPPGRTWVELDGNVIYDSMQEKKLSDVIGLIAVGRGGAMQTRFPFRLAADQDAGRLDRSLAESIKSRFGKAGFPTRLLDFTDDEWSIDQCTPMPAGLGLGLLGEWLRLRKGTACIVSWKGERPAAMLISVSQADGDPWMRPFSRRLCRVITEAALAQADGRAAPTYAACILADRPRRSGAREVLSDYVYEIRPHHQLALMD
jgi:hypothetical protein